MNIAAKAAELQNGGLQQDISTALRSLASSGNKDDTKLYDSIMGGTTTVQDGTTETGAIQRSFDSNGNSVITLGSGASQGKALDMSVLFASMAGGEQMTDGMTASAYDRVKMESAVEATYGTSEISDAMLADLAVNKAKMAEVENYVGPTVTTHDNLTGSGGVAASGESGTEPLNPTLLPQQFGTLTEQEASLFNMVPAGGDPFNLGTSGAYMLDPTVAYENVPNGNLALNLQGGSTPNPLNQFAGWVDSGADAVTGFLKPQASAAVMQGTSPGTLSTGLQWATDQGLGYLNGGNLLNQGIDAGLGWLAQNGVPQLTTLHADNGTPTGGNLNLVADVSKVVAIKSTPDAVNQVQSDVQDMMPQGGANVSAQSYSGTPIALENVSKSMQDFSTLPVRFYDGNSTTGDFSTIYGFTPPSPISLINNNFNSDLTGLITNVNYGFNYGINSSGTQLNAQIEARTSNPLALYQGQSLNAFENNSAIMLSFSLQNKQDGVNTYMRFIAGNTFAYQAGFKVVW